jgi:hypothetical protein
MIILFVLLIVALLMWIVFESFHVFEEGAPAKDQDILEMLELKGKDYAIDQTWDDKFLLKSLSYKVSVPYIHQTKYSILFPYYISDIGVIPVWYKSAKVLNQMFKEKIAASEYKVTKRDKLGLGK